MTQLLPTSVLRFKRGYRLQHDKVRHQWIIQAPERAFVANPIAATILQHVDGTRSVEEIINHLASSFDASRETIAHDVMTLLSGLVEKGMLNL